MNHLASIETIIEQCATESKDHFSAINKILINPLTSVIHAQYLEDLNFTIYKRQQVRLRFETELLLIKSDFLALEKRHEHFRVELKKLQEQLNDFQLDDSVKKLLIKAEKYFLSNHFRIGFNLNSKNQIDLFKYANSDSIEKGTLDEYISKFKVNIENNWDSFRSASTNFG